MGDTQKTIWAVLELETLLHLDALTPAHCQSARLTLDTARHELSIGLYFELGCRIWLVEQFGYPICPEPSAC